MATTALTAKSGSLLTRLLATIAIICVYVFGSLATAGAVMTFGATKAEAGRRGGAGEGGVEDAAGAAAGEEAAGEEGAASTMAVATAPCSAFAALTSMAGEAAPTIGVRGAAAADAGPWRGGHLRDVRLLHFYASLRHAPLCAQSRPATRSKR